MRRILLAVGSIVALVSATLVITAGAAPGAGGPRYLDANAPTSERVNDLLHRMTLAEKVGQMDQIVIGKLRDTTSPANGDCNNAGGNNDPLQTSCLQRVLIDYRTGSILSGGTDNPRTTPVTLGAEKEGRLPPPSRLKGPSSNGDSPTNREWDSPLRGQSLH